MYKNLSLKTTKSIKLHLFENFLMKRVIFGKFLTFVFIPNNEVCFCVTELASFLLFPIHLA